MKMEDNRNFLSWRSCWDCYLGSPKLDTFRIVPWLLQCWPGISCRLLCPGLQDLQGDLLCRTARVGKWGEAVHAPHSGRAEQAEGQQEHRHRDLPLWLIRNPLYISRQHRNTWCQVRMKIFLVNIKQLNTTTALHTGKLRRVIDSELARANSLLFMA